jgi:putative DNA primase/helicase
MDELQKSKLSLSQIAEIQKLRIGRPDVDIAALVSLIADGVFDGKALIVENLRIATEIVGPFDVDKGGMIWHYRGGVWLPDGEAELARRVLLCTGARYRKDQVSQVASIIKARIPNIDGLGPSRLINTKNGMLNWRTLKLLPHEPKYFSTYQLTVNWNPEAECPEVDKWMAKMFEPDIIKLLWQVIGVVVHPGMGFQKAIALIGGGFNGKGTFLRLCQNLLPESAVSAIDPRTLTTNRFAGSDLFGSTANICGDIERFTFTSTAEFKKMTGNDTLRAERKGHHAFTFVSEATNLFSGNEMPQSR